MAGTAKALSRAALMLSQRQHLGSSQVFYTQTAPIRAQQARWFTPSPFTYLPKKDGFSSQDFEDLPEYSVENFTEDEKSMYEMISPEERAVFDTENRQFVEIWNDPAGRKNDDDMISESAASIEKETKLRFGEIREKGRGFWAEDEDDEFTNAEDGDDTFNDDEITSMAHAELELHREVREYARIAAWDMPLLSNLTKKFQLPQENQILRFRYTNYMGEQHPAEHKVVVELSSKDLVPKHLSEAQRQTFLKLVGTRYNPETDIVRMSCEKFSARAQNKRYLGDNIKSLIKEAKEGDSFADVPLDLRHHKTKPRYTFPESWKMTDTRLRQITTDRENRLRIEQERSTVVDGKESVLHAIRTLPALSQHPQLGVGEERVAVKEAVRRGKPGAQKLRR